MSDKTIKMPPPRVSEKKTIGISFSQGAFEHLAVMSKRAGIPENKSAETAVHALEIADYVLQKLEEGYTFLIEKDGEVTRQVEFFKYDERAVESSPTP